MKLSRFVLTDLVILLLLGVFIEFINLRLIENLHIVASFSLVYVIILMILIRWHGKGIVAVIVLNIIRMIILFDSVNLLFLISESSLILIVILMKIMKLDKKQLNILHLLTLTVALVLLSNVSYTCLNVIKYNIGFISTFIHFASKDLFTFAMNSVVLLLVYRQRILLIYIPHYYAIKNDEII